MRVTRPTLSIFLNEVDQLEKDAIALREVAKEWTRMQNNREEGWGADQYWVQVTRRKLEKAVIKYRQQLAKIYDFTGDSGLR